jgi:hypothetical protein
MIGLGGFQPLLDEVDIALGRFDAALRLLLERVQHIDSRTKANGVNSAVGVPVEILDEFNRTTTEAFQQLRGWGMLSELCQKLLKAECILHSRRKIPVVLPA